MKICSYQLEFQPAIDLRCADRNKEFTSFDCWGVLEFYDFPQEKTSAGDQRFIVNLGKPQAINDRKNGVNFGK